MGNIILTRRAWLGETSALLRDVRGLWSDPASGLVVAVSAQAITSLRVAGGAAPALLHSAGFESLLTPTLADDLYALPGAPARLILGDEGSGLWGYDLRVDGSFGQRVLLPAPQAGRLDLQALVSGPGGRLYSAGSDGAGIGVMQDRGSAFWFAGFTLDTHNTAAAGITALDVAQMGGAAFVIAAASGEAGVSAWQIAESGGGLTHTASLGAAQGLGLLRNLTDLHSVTVGGQMLVLVASTSSSASMGALTVMGLSETGALTALDHILDTRETRFGGVQSLSVAEARGRTYVAAGGSDDGVAVFVLMPDGRLVHLARFVDQLDTGLQNVSELALMPVGAEMQLLVTAQGEAGLTQLVFALPEQGVSRLAAATGGQLEGSAGGDALSGGRGKDVILGLNGDDILSDGPGQDTLWGGAGADVFALAGDGVLDRIADFEPWADWLDLSGLPMLYDTSQVEIRSTAQGASLQWRGELLELLSVTGGPLSAAQVQSRILTMPDRPLLIAPRRFDGGAAPEIRMGHDGPDEMHGGGGADTLRALAGDDTLDGGPGYDVLHGGAGHDLVRGGLGRDTIWLGFGNDRFEDVSQDDQHGGDRVMGWEGNDTLLGLGGEDVLFGHAGQDSLTGGVGNDRLYGGAGYDTLEAGPGDDHVYGGAGRDLVRLGEGHDVFFDSPQADLHGRDTVLAGDGNDTLQGGGGDDWFAGQGGDDLIWARGGNDTVFGGDGDDTLGGGIGDDQLQGGAGRDLAYLGDGHDRYADDAGADRVHGGAGNDTINAGGGNDTLWGDAGEDVFVFATSPGARVIRDFEPGFDRVEIDGPVGGLVRQVAGGVLAEWEGGSVLLQGIALESLHSGDLVFL